MDIILDFIKQFSFFDLIYLVITILSLIKCYKKGFILSLLSASKWLLAYVVTLILFPKTKPFVEDIIDNEYVLDVTLGVCLFILVIFIILLINKGISKAVTYTGIGNLDKFFGFFFGFIRGYIISVCIFATIDIIYNSDKWPIDIDKSFSFQIVEKGSNYLINEFPDKKEYEDTKEKVQEL
ncbi:CvpA family protein [Candidatus Pelagibacter sp.]|nr:CvpA family protein [Candidatus Pelagibacter sp.]